MPCPDVPDDPTPSSHLTKGCIHWYDTEPDYENISSKKARPYIIIGRNNFNSSRTMIAPLSDIKNYSINGKLKYPYHASLYVSNNNFLDKDSVILLDQIYTIPKDELWKEWYMGEANDLQKIDMALCYNFDLFDTIKYVTNSFVGHIEEWHKNKYRRS